MTARKHPVRTEEGRRVRRSIARPAGRLCRRITTDRTAHHGDLSTTRCSAAFADGEDIHRATAASVCRAAGRSQSQQRRYAKTINFGRSYGMSAFGLAAQLEIDRSAAASLIDRDLARYPGRGRLTWRAPASTRANKAMRKLLGRRLWLPTSTPPTP